MYQHLSAVSFGLLGTLLLQQPSVPPTTVKFVSDAMVEVLGSRDAKGNPAVPASNTIVVDAAVYRHVFDSLGFVSPKTVPNRGSVDGRGFAIADRASLRSCSRIRGVERCVLPPSTSVVRFSGPKWIEPGRVLEINIGLSHRVDGPSGYVGTGGGVSTYTFELREGKWVATKVRWKISA